MSYLCHIEYIGGLTPSYKHIVDDLNVKGLRSKLPIKSGYKSQYKGHLRKTKLTRVCVKHEFFILWLYPSPHLPYERPSH